MAAHHARWAHSVGRIGSARVFSVINRFMTLLSTVSHNMSVRIAGAWRKKGLRNKASDDARLF